MLTGNTAEFLGPVFSFGVTFATESSLVVAKPIARQLNRETVDRENDYAVHMKESVKVFLPM